MQRHVLSGGRYPVLRSLAILYVIGAAVTILATIAGVCFIYARAPGTILDRTIMSIGAVVAAFFLFISLLAVAEALKLFIDIEHNTRANALTRAISPTEVTTPMMPLAAGSDGRSNRLHELDEETAEAALLRGH
jgi:hypothetical protein